MFLVNFHALFVQYTDIANVVLAAVMKLAKFHWIVKFFDLCLVEFVPELTPHRIKHNFSQGANTRIFLDLRRLELYIFFGIVIGDILLSLC